MYVSGDRRIIKDDQYFIDERIVIWESSAIGGQREDDEPPLESEDKDGRAPDNGGGKVGDDGDYDVESILEVGGHEFHFSYQLPLENIPCSLESRACCVRYHLRAILDLLTASSSTTSPPPPPVTEIPQGIKYFTIIGPIVDCNDNKYLVSGRSFEEDTEEVNPYALLSFLLPRTRSLDQRSGGVTASVAANKPPLCAASWTGTPFVRGRRSGSSHSSRITPPRLSS